MSMSGQLELTGDRLPWHQMQWARIERAAVRDRLHHAILLKGPRGLGKRLFAHQLAGGLLCEATPASGDLRACGQCRACRLSLAGNHPDWHRLEPEEDKRSIGVDAVRQMIEALSLTSQSAGPKLVIVHPAEWLTHSAANTLLKTLEEPPGNAVFLLLATRPGTLPATVRSRCQSLAFTAPTREVALDWLRRAASGSSEAGATGSDSARALDEAELEKALAECSGGPVAALELARSGEMPAREKRRQEVRQLLLGRVNPLRVAEGWREAGLEEVLSAIERVCLDATAARLRSLSDASGPPGAEASHSPQIAAVQSLDFNHLLKLQAACADLRRAMLAAGSVNEQLSAENLAMLCSRHQHSG